MVDEARLRMISDGDAEGLQYLLGIYLRETEKELRQLRDAVANRAVNEVERRAHGIAGSSLSYGMNAIVPVLRALEQEAQRSDLSRATERLDDAEHNFARIQNFLSLRYPHPPK